jgi:hypothetical protein
MFMAKVTISQAAAPFPNQGVSPQGAVNLKNKQQIY